MHLDISIAEDSDNIVSILSVHELHMNITLSMKGKDKALTDGVVKL